MENSLVGIYVKCRSMTDAWRVFHKMPSQNVVTWTAMISGRGILAGAVGTGTIPKNAPGRHVAV